MLAMLCGSSVLCTIYITMCTWYGKWTAYFPDTDVYVGIVCSICCLPLSTSQVGLSHRTMWVLYCTAVPFYFIYMYYRIRVIVTPYEICASVLAFAILLFDEACRESDIKLMYDTLSTGNRRNMFQEREAKHGQDTTGNSFSASSEIAYTLITIVESLKTLSELGDDSTEEVYLPNRSTNHVEHTWKRYVGYRWVKSAAHIYEARMLCLSMIMTSIPGEDMSTDVADLLKEEQFKLSYITTRLYSAMEAARGHALPLFIDERTTDLLITAARGLCEILLFLLLYDSLGETLLEQSPVKCICWLRCSIVDGAWSITMSTTRVYDDQSMPFTQGPTHVYDDQKTHANANGDRQPSKQRLKQAKVSPLMLLIRSLAERYLRKQIEVSESVDQNSGIAVSHQSFRIPGKVLTIIAEDTDLLYPTLNAVWLIVDCHVSARDLRVYERLVFALRNLDIPYKTCREVDDLHHLKQQHAVVIISEIGLTAKHLDVSIDLMRLNGGSLLVVSSHNAPSHFKDLYGLDVAHCISVSAKKIFHDLLAIYAPQKPRLLRNRNQAALFSDRSTDET